MGFFDLFRKRDPIELNPKVLVCSLGSGFDGLVSEDDDAYRLYFADTITKSFENVADLLSEISSGYDIVHLYAIVTQDGIGTSTVTGTELIERATHAGTKLLWIANGNDVEGYIQHFKPGHNKLNLVMTIDRLGEKFPTFLRNLLGEMKSGKSMPVAWNRIAPQIPGRDHTDAPDAIFFNGLGQKRFI